MNLLNNLKNLASDVTHTGSSSSGSSGPLENWFITVLGAEGVHDVDDISKSDPYVKVEFGGKSFETRTIHNNRNPQWNQTFQCQLYPNSYKDLQLTLKDKDIGLDDTIGKGTVSHAEFPSHSGEEKLVRVAILHDGQACGIIKLQLKKVIEGQNSSYNSQQQQTYTQSSYSQQQPMSTSHNQNVPPNYNTSFNSQQPYQSQGGSYPPQGGSFQGGSYPQGGSFQSQVPSSQGGSYPQQQSGSYQSQIPSTNYPSNTGQNQYSQGSQGFSQQRHEESGNSNYYGRK